MVLAMRPFVHDFDAAAEHRADYLISLLDTDTGIWTVFSYSDHSSTRPGLESDMHKESLTCIAMEKICWTGSLSIYLA